MSELQQPDHCLDISLVIAKRDSELTATELEQVNTHMAACADCAADERLVTTGGREVYALLASLDSQKSTVPESAAALAKLQARLTAKAPGTTHPPVPQALPVKKVTPKYWYQRRRTWLSTLVAAALVVLLLLPPGQAIADQFLSLFRVQQFQPVSVDPKEFQSHPLPGIESFGDMQSAVNFLSSHENLTGAQAQKLVHFHILSPGYLPKGISHVASFAVLDGGQVTFTFSGAKTHAYLVKNGYTHIQIPANLDGAKFTITVSSGVMIYYSGRSQSPFMVGEIPSPTVRASGSVSLNELRDFLISLPNMPPHLVTQLRQIDLNSGTLPLPVPPQVSAQHVSIHGAPGLLLGDSTPIGGLVLWQTHGMIYAVGGPLGDATQLLDTANSLH